MSDNGQWTMNNGRWTITPPRPLATPPLKGAENCCRQTPLPFEGKGKAWGETKFRLPAFNSLTS